MLLVSLNCVCLDGGVIKSVVRPFLCASVAVCPFHLISGLIYASPDFMLHPIFWLEFLFSPFCVLLAYPRSRSPLCLLVKKLPEVVLGSWFQSRQYNSPVP